VLNDLDILFMTFIALFPRMRKERIKESALDKGPLISFFYGFFNWFLIDLAVAGVATSISIFVWRLSMPLNIGFLNAALLASLVALGFSFTNVIFGLNRIAWRHAPGEAIMDVGISTGLTTLFIAILDMLIPSIQIPLGILILTGVLSFIGFSMARYRERLLTGLASRWLRLRGEVEHVGERAIIIGAGELGLQTSWYIKHGYLKRVLSVVGFVDDNVYKENLIFDSSPVLGKVSDLPELVEKHHVDILIFAIEKISKYRQQRIEIICGKTQAQFIHTRNLVNNLNNFIGPHMEIKKLTSSRESLAKFLEQLDDCLAQEDLSRARALIENVRQNLEITASEK
jgi:FlaA1/EpsC-like NDP-sugar epimerase